MTILIGLAVAVCIVAGLWAWLLAGREVPFYRTPPREVGFRFLQMCVFTPLHEEAVYRLALCVPLAALSRPWTAIVLSGLIFGLLHFLYGNPSPENLVGGFFLAWAFLKSGSIYVPVLLHSLGNCCALAAQVGAWFWL
jgi:CAAX protease family protein